MDIAEVNTGLSVVVGQSKLENNTARKELEEQKSNLVVENNTENMNNLLDSTDGQVKRNVAESNRFPEADLQGVRLWKDQLDKGQLMNSHGRKCSSIYDKLTCYTYKQLRDFAGYLGIVVLKNQRKQEILTCISEKIDKTEIPDQLTKRRKRVNSNTPKPKTGKKLKKEESKEHLQEMNESYMARRREILEQEEARQQEKNKLLCHKLKLETEAMLYETLKKMRADLELLVKNKAEESQIEFQRRMVENLQDEMLATREGKSSSEQMM